MRKHEMTFIRKENPLILIRRWLLLTKQHDINIRSRSANMQTILPCIPLIYILHTTYMYMYMQSPLFNYIFIPLEAWQSVLFVVYSICVDRWHHTHPENCSASIRNFIFIFNMFSKIKKHVRSICWTAWSTSDSTILTRYFRVLPGIQVQENRMIWRRWKSQMSEARWLNKQINAIV